MVIKRIIERRFSAQIMSFSRLSGGDINDVYHYRTSKGNFVVKVNDKKRFPNMLSKEKQGLDLLKQAKIQTPVVVDQFEEGKDQFLLLEFIDQVRPEREFWQRFAFDLAKLHSKSEVYFGLNHDNYIGSLPQKNSTKSTWQNFFIEQRLLPLIKQAFEKQLLNETQLLRFENLFKAIENVIPLEKPSLLHGDLWSGNLMCQIGQIPRFIDPAVYYGHREVDIAMTFMFGGFDKSFLHTYNDIFPLEKDWEQRLEIHNLYPNLVHLILFGPSYLSGIDKVLRKFS